jgi:hypothetical protein
MDLSIVAILPLHLLGPNCPVLNNFLTSVAPRRILQLLYAEDLLCLSVVTALVSQSVVLVNEISVA